MHDFQTGFKEPSFSFAGILPQDDFQDCYDWDRLARPDQKIPSGDWRVWLVLAGRGFGKTRLGAESIRQWVQEGVCKRIALIGETEMDVRHVMIEGQSGLLPVHPPHERPKFESSKRQLKWPNGAIATVYSAERYGQLRGPQFDGAWIDELAKFRGADEVWDHLNLALRIGKNPRVIITTTPKPLRLIKKIVNAEGKWAVVTRGATYDNSQNLSPAFIEFIRSEYEGTRLGAQEVYGEILDDREGALWTLELIEKAKFEETDKPTLIRIVIGVDPATRGQKTNDETGIIVAGVGEDKKAYVLEDLSGHFSPNEWALRVVQAYQRYHADKVVAEINQGGDMVEALLKTHAPTIRYKGVHALRSKVMRAEPVVALYEQGKVYHVHNNDLRLLERQMTEYKPGSSRVSPDRLDALVWALTELMLQPSRSYYRILNDYFDKKVH
jgi:predicted phage terminase large subunit-like protein